MIQWNKGLCYNANQCCDEERCYCNEYYEKANKALKKAGINARVVPAQGKLATQGYEYSIEFPEGTSQDTITKAAIVVNRACGLSAWDYDNQQAS